MFSGSPPNASICVIVVRNERIVFHSSTIFNEKTHLTVFDHLLPFTVLFLIGLPPFQQLGCYYVYISTYGYPYN